MFLLVGLLFLVVGCVLYVRTDEFLRDSAQADGVVRDLVLRRSSGTSSGTYYPVVEFTTPNGETVEFVNSVGSQPPSYRKGEEVGVRYDVENPYKARIDSFVSNWLLVIIFGTMGSIFTVLAVLLLASAGKKAAEGQWLMNFGRVIMSEFQRVELNTSIKMNGKSPYRIITQWQDPGSGKVYVFQSRNIWFNPESYIQGKDIAVRIDPNNPKTYMVDIGFLPKSGNSE
ncbi:MAG: DUF3592 domain-containing protein [Verrucomicrobia bacterium]|nr:DUF3592 domain-containing protein [Verrucomicrobiota bacterium]